MKARVDGVLPMGDLVADRYRIERELGRGGMAVAYAVYDTLSGRPLALKRLLQSSADANRNVGEHEAAVGLAEESLALGLALDSHGLLLGSAHETRAWVALKGGDRVGFEEHAKKCADVYCGSDKPLFTARYAALIAAAEAPRVTVQGDVAEAAVSATVQIIAELSLETFTEPNARARAALHTLLTFTNAECGLMYTLRTDGFQMAAREAPCYRRRTTLVSVYLEAEIDGWQADTISSPLETEGSGEAREAWQGPDGTQFAPLSLTHADERELWITGLLVVRRSDLSRFPQQLLSAISRTLHESGDAKTMRVG